MYEYKYLSELDRQLILRDKIFGIEKNIYSLSLSKIEVELRGDLEGSNLIDQEIENCSIFLDILKNMLEQGID